MLDHLIRAARNNATGANVFSPELVGRHLGHGQIGNAFVVRGKDSRAAETNALKSMADLGHHFQISVEVAGISRSMRKHTSF